MTKIITITNQKGGTGKTTTTVNLGVALAKMRERVLLVDSDPQANLTSHLFKEQVFDYNLSGLIYGELYRMVYNIQDYIEPSSEFVDVLPSDIDLAGLETQMAGAINREKILGKVLSHMQTSKYDYILIDTPPTLGMLSINAMAVANNVMIPVQCEPFATKGLDSLLQTLEMVKEINPKLQVGSIILTMADERTNLTKQIIEEIHCRYDQELKIFDTKIPRAVAMSKASGEGRSGIAYAPTSDASMAYQKLAKEVLYDGRQKANTRALSR